MKITNTKVLIAAVCLAVAVCIFAVWKLHNPVSDTLTIDTSSGYYGLFIGDHNEDNDYFSTTDANVRNIIRTYLDKQKEYQEYGREATDAQRFGYSIIYYYDKDAFIAGSLGDWRDINSLSGFTLYDMKTGKQISPCAIYAQAGLYEEGDLLLSVSYTGEAPYAKNGVCLYERGAPNFTFIDLTSKLGANETLFSDPTGQGLWAHIRNVDSRKGMFAVDVYDTTKTDAEGKYAYKRSIAVSYFDQP